MYGQQQRCPRHGGGRNAETAQALARINHAVVKAHSDLLSTGESVSTWRVSKSALLTLQADSMDSLGFRMQHIPYLNRLMVIEGKVNSFIHCFVGVQKVTSLYDLEVAICESEGIQQFEELELGPLLRHPLVVHYFSVGSDVTEVFKITSAEIISFLGILLRIRKKVEVDDLLDYIAKRRKGSRENLCVRIQSLGMHIGHIVRARRSESASLKRNLDGLNMKSDHEYNEDEDGDNAQNEDNNKDDNDAQSSRTWLDTKMDVKLSSHEGISHNGQNVPSRGEKRPENKICTISVFHKPLMLDGSKILGDDMEKGFLDMNGVDCHTNRFIKTWREACANKNVAEVFDLMLEFYQKNKNKRKVKPGQMFSSYPYVGLLNVAVASIKFGLWDSMNGSSQAFSQHEIAKTISEMCAGNVNVEVELSEKDVQVARKHVFEHRHDVAVEDILKNVSAYFKLSDDIPDNENPPEKNLIFLRKLCKCESWLTEQFSVKDFESLGYGDFFKFLEKHVSLLPPTYQKCFLITDTSEKPSVEVCMSQHHLVEFLSQASNSLGEHEFLTKRKVSELLTMQYPSVGLTLVENDPAKDFLDTVRVNKSNISSILFSATLSASHSEKGFSASHVTTKDAIEVLLRAPMLIDLDSWSYWDLKFAPSLGPLMGWLLNEVKTKELQCLVTRDGKVLRIDHSATVDSFLEVFLQGSSFQTAVKLLSLFALYGGERNVPLSLLKCHAKNAFEVIIKSYTDRELKDGQRNLLSDLNKSKSKSNGSKVPTASRFTLDCLSYLPKEFHGFAADLLLSGFRAIVKDAPSVILSECRDKADHLMLHELGILLGIVEWTDNQCTICLPESTKLSEYNRRKDTSNRSSSENEVMISDNEECKGDRVTVHRVDSSGDGLIQHLLQLEKEKDSASVIESIRREEFGLDPNLSTTEISILKKQHARLGRALHCLSQELYSQDSHFLLELVQNADDNVYPRNAEPTLTFILQEKGIVVLNNEQGFSVENIRALCDVGNSTKKASTAGYIGKKGIGFKSVFRVTDAPEIHSNGFHIKFDLSEGQIGFVLPTIVPPCDIDLFSNLVSVDTDPMDTHDWNTCIVLPFKSKLTEISAMDNIISMFADFHPSLLLFLHRLECIKFRNMLNNSLITMRKEIVKDGIVKVSFGKEKLTWFVDSRILRADATRHDVQTTEISIAFALEVSSHGSYIPKLDTQHVFAFLPLRAYGLKFIIQGDFILPSSREEVDGDSPWNQWLLSEFPILFVSAERSFCSLPGFRENPGKGVSAFMSFVPLVGEVHGFFSSLPRMIISKLCTSNCLLSEWDNNEWVPPCKVLRNWNEQVRTLLPDSFLQEHLGLGYLNKDIVLSDSLARALGIEECGPKILVQIMSSLCRTEGGVKSMGIGWVSSWLNTLYEMSLHYSRQSSLDFGSGSDVLNSLRKIPFIPLLDGEYGSIDEGTIWLNTDALCTSVDDEYGLEAFAKLFAKLRIVSPSLFYGSVLENLSQMLYEVGVQRLSAHEVVKVHVLPAISDEKNTRGNKDLMTEYLSFIMVHLQSSCPNCSVERVQIISEVYNKAFILTNYGYVRPVEVAIHFNNDFGNHIDMDRLIKESNMKWYKIDASYLRYPVAKSSSLSGDLLKWRKFLQEVGVTDFVQTVQVERTVPITSQFVLNNIMWEKEIIYPGSTVKDWDSQELVHLLSEVSSSGDRERCKYLLEVLDTIWDDYFSDKVAAYCNNNGEGKLFKSSLISILNDFQWIASSVDDKLYYPKDLFHDCEAVRSILGDNAPYAVPQVQSEKLLNDIGFKINVTLGDTSSVLEVWERSEIPFEARFYTFVWNELASSDTKILENLQSGAFIFVPYPSTSSSEVVLPGVFLSPQEVYWHDYTGSMEQIKTILPQCDLDEAHQPLSKMLCNLYPGLHDFFVNNCGVNENPPLLHYLQILLQLSTVNTPSQAAKRVFQVFLEWTDGLESGVMSSEDVETLKGSLEKKEFKVLPTAQDKWVSLHPSFGLVCWCDDEKLIGEFEGLNNIDFFSLCELSDEEKEMLQAKVSILMKRLGIPALSEVVTREAIYYGTADGSFETSLIRWALPYAQRYIYNAHPNRYIQLKLSGFENLNRLRIIVVEELFYRNVIKRLKIGSKKRLECSCLLQDDVLYTTWESDSHAIFMELSRFLVDGNPELHLANFLHMITTMTESGSTEEQIETFILNSQKVPKLPDQEPIWSLQSKPSSVEYEGSPITTRISKMIDESNASKCRKRSGANWPPVNWTTAPRPTNVLETQNIAMQTDLKASVVEVNTDWNIEEHLVSPNPIVNSQNSKDSCMNVENDSIDPGSTNSNQIDQLSCITAAPEQAFLTGRLGEEVAFKYFSRKLGENLVKWVNEDNETGLPYDIVVCDGQETRKEYVEVKATESATKDWFEISAREWQFALKKGESFSIARVLFLGNNSARVTTYKNPVRLCQLGHLKLAVVVSKQPQED